MFLRNYFIGRQLRKLPGPPELDVSNMTKEEFWNMMNESIEECKRGECIPFDEAIKMLEEEFGSKLT